MASKSDVRRMNRADRLEDLFQQALTLDPGVRASFLSEACAGDEDLRAEVRALLEFDREAGAAPFWSGPAIDASARTEAAIESRSIEGRIGQMMGAYRIVAVIGAGGMGTVYRARRDDSEFNKDVAIKVIKRGMDTDLIVRRFRHERQILANLEHPHIARLIDGGTTRDGIPYLVMEYVDGRPLLEYAVSEKLSLRARLQLFCAVCGAVEYAHRNLVIHRDLKPANILVTPAGSPKLLDFGVAKLLGAERSPGDAAPETLLSGCFLTPEYASPEQVRGEAVTTVSDVYSLGVLLYRLLAGRSLYDLQSGAAQEIARAVCEAHPRPPSAVIPKGQEKLRRDLRGDLDLIVLMALSKEPERRYSSVEQLSSDIQRHLQGRPVHAQRDTLAYRVRKYFRRRPGTVAALSAVLVTLLGGIVGTTWQAHSANLHRQIAERRLRDVRRLSNSMVVDIQDATRDIPGTLAVRQMILRRGVAFLDELAREKSDDDALLMELAAAYEKIGDSNFDVDQSIQLHRKALAIRQRRGEPVNGTLAADLATSYGRIANLLKQKGDTAGSETLFRRAAELSEDLARREPANTVYEQLLVVADSDMGMILDQAGKTPEALQYLQRSLGVAEDLRRKYPENPEYGQNMFVVWTYFSRALKEQGDFQQALEYNRRNIEWVESLLAREPARADLRRDMWMVHHDQAQILQKIGRIAAAETAVRKGLPFLEELAAADPGDKGHQRGIAVTYLTLGDILGGLHRPREAQASYRMAIVRSEGLLAADPHKIETTKDLARIYSHSGLLWLRSGNFAETRKALNRARELFDRSATVDPGDARMAAGRSEAYQGLDELARRSPGTTGLH